MEASGRRVQSTSRWKSLCARRGGEERVQEKGATTSNDTDGGEAGHREKEKIQKLGEDRWGGRDRITCVISNGS